MPNPKELPSVYVVMFTAVARFVRGCRVTIDDLFHPNLPERSGHLQRLLELGAIKPESDPEAALVPVAEPAAGAAPIIVAGAELNLTPTSMRQRMVDNAAPRP